MYKKLTETQIMEICILYKEGVLSPELGKMFNVYPGTIRNHLKNNGITIKSMDRREKINPGDKFGRWIIVKEVETRKRQRYFLCECSCVDKTRKKIQLHSLKSGLSSSCGCYNRELASERGLNTGKNYTGQIFGRLTILSEIERNKHGKRQVMAQCSCDGNIDKYVLERLKSGVTTSCGCYSSEKRVERTYQVKDYQEKYPLFCQVEEIRDCEDGVGIEVRCKHSDCRKWFKPVNGQLNGRITAIEKPERKSIGTEHNFYCSDKCKHSCPLYNLHSDPFERKEVSGNTPTQYELSIWSDEVLKQQFEQYGYNFCTKCQGKENLASHHIDPKKLEPFYALDPDNGVVFCRDCHLNDAHSGTCSTGALANTVCK